MSFPGLLPYLSIFYGLGLVVQLSGCASPSHLKVHKLPHPGPERMVKVLAVADGRYRAAHPRWQETLKKNIAEVSYLYQREFGIALDLVDARVWQENKGAKDLAALKRAYPITCDYEVVMGFTVGSGLLAASVAEILGNHLLIAATPLHSTTKLLAHEMGHIFGARDTFTTSATQFFLGPLSPSLLPKSFRAAVHKHKWRLFRLPLSNK